ncbi:hypothetical protein GQ42DRAFT_166452 [Ramicandelaber brevisporus]|nr:hypothetical protein GQ42DRAFT_166452 [Ramicandelaber brevisporus]
MLTGSIRTRAATTLQFAATRTQPQSTCYKRLLWTDGRRSPSADSSASFAERARSSSATALIASPFIVAYAADSRAAVWRWSLPVVFKLFDGEDAHKLAIRAAELGLLPREQKQNDYEHLLTVNVFGKKLDNPVGLAAGFDKNGQAIDSMLGLGFGLVEIGSITPLPQDGNARPRVFRLEEDECVINRYGFNSDGGELVEKRLRERLWNLALKHKSDKATTTEQAVNELTSMAGSEGRVLGINLGKNKVSPAESFDDYVNGVNRFAPYADYLVVNVSSPNTPGLRSLQRREMIEDLLKAVISARDSLPATTSVNNKPPVLIKIAPDLSAEELVDIAHAVRNSKVDGVIVSNTTISRPSTLQSDPSIVAETGGLSGKVLKDLSLSTLRKLYKLTDGKVLLVGCGGISTGKDAVEFAEAGATLVQLYTSMVYRGLGIPRFVKDEIIEKLNGRKWMDIIGSKA